MHSTLTTNGVSARARRSPRYGCYFLRPYLVGFSLVAVLGIGLLATGVALGRGLYLVLGAAVILYSATTLVLWLLARYVIPGNRIDVARNAVATLQLSGGERVLDLGTGRGLYAIETAKALTTGNVSAVDVWDPTALGDLTYHHGLSQPSGNALAKALENARIEGVDHQIEFTNMDANHLHFSDDCFDVVTSAFVISHLPRHAAQVLAELRRVLKPEGRLLVVDNFRDFTYFLLSTPHFFVLSYLRGKNAKTLTRDAWIETLRRADFEIASVRARRSVIVLLARAATKVSN